MSFQLLNEINNLFHLNKATLEQLLGWLAAHAANSADPDTVTQVTKILKPFIPMQAGPDRAWMCPVCGEPLDGKEILCPKCGQRISYEWLTEEDGEEKYIEI